MKIMKKIYGIALVLTCGLAATLKAQNLYVANIDGGGYIGEYTTCGATINASLITAPGINGMGNCTAIAISGNDMFVANAAGTVGEYTLSGATVNASLITGLYLPEGIVVSGTNLFVAGANSDTVGEYTTSGQTINASLISGLSDPAGLAISGTNLFVVSGSADGDAGGVVGEYTTSGVPENTNLIIGLTDPYGIAISGNDVFVAGDTGGLYGGTGCVGEYTTCGRTVNADLISGLDAPTGIAILGTNLFVVASSPGCVIGEYTTAGATVNASLITTGLNVPYGIAIGTPPPPTFSSISVSGSTLNLAATNGPAGGTYTLLESTNLALPVTQWTPVLTNSFDSNGDLSVATNIVSGASSAAFYILEVP
jgi:hypothetical protein